MKRISLSATHRRSLSVVARNVEQSLNDIVARVCDDCPNAILDRIERSYSESQRREILTAVEAMREILHEFIVTFELNLSSVTEEQILNAHCAHLWTLLQDSHFDKLKSYGALNNELRDPLNERIERLLKCVERLRIVSFH